MAPTLTFNSFFLTTPPPSRLLTQKNPKLSVSTEAFRFGKQDNGTESSSEEEGSTKSNKLSFDFTKIPNVNSLIPVVSKPASGLSLGQQRLLREGFSVRAGVPDLGAAQELARVAAQYKVVEVSTDPSAPLKAVEQLFSSIPEDGRRQAYAEAMARAKAEEEAQNASEKAREAAVAAKMLEEVKKLSEQEAQAASLAEEAQKKAEAAGTSLENLMSKSKDIISAESLLNKAKDISTGWSWEKLSSQIATAVPKPDENPKVQIATVRGQAKARTLPPKKAVVKPTPKAPSSLPKKSKTEQNESKKEVKNVFGGLFKQETIYIDDD